MGRNSVVQYCQTSDGLSTTAVAAAAAGDDGNQTGSRPPSTDRKPSVVTLFLCADNASRRKYGSGNDR